MATDAIDEQLDVEEVVEDVPVPRSDKDSGGDDLFAWSQRANMRAARIAEDLAPEAAWPTDEEYPYEAFVAMWRAAQDSRPRRRRVWSVDPVTEPLFDAWLANLGRLGAEQLL